MIFPRVKSQIESMYNAEIPLCISVSVDNKFSQKICSLLGFFLPQCTFSEQTKNAIITAEYVDDFKSEKYKLTINQGKIHIRYFDYLGLRNALATLSLLIRVKDDRCLIHNTIIEDEPSLEHRGVMLDLARGVKDIHLLTNDMILAAKARMNYLHFHLADGGGVCMKLDALPKECYTSNAYTKEQMREICNVADILGLEIIPEYDMPAHSNTLLCVFENLRCDTDAPEPHSRHAACSGTPQLYEIYEKIIKEIADFFPGKYLHIGGDELDFADVPHLGALCYWDSCSKCKAFREKHGLKDRQEQYYYIMCRMNEIVKASGKTTVMWSDQIDCTRPAVLPKDILMQFWRVAGEGRGPHDGCSMNGQLKMGYTIVNSYYPQAYGDEEEYMSSEKLASWQCFTDPECEKEYIDQIIGSEVCLWNYGDKSPKFAHYDYSAPSAIVLMADKLWNNDKIEYTEEYAIALTRTLLGAGVPENLNVFAAIGDILPPRTEKLSYYEKVSISKKDIESIILALSEDGTYLTGDANRSIIYKACAEYTLSHL